MISIIAPSLDDKRIYPLRQLVPGAVHRSRVVIRHASGKGANAARAITTLGGRALLCALAGQEMREQLEEQFSFSFVRLDLIATRQPTRSCITVLEENGRATELVQEALPVERDEAELFSARAAAACRGSSTVLLTGSLPAGLPEDVYSGCAKAAKAEGALVVIDTQRTPLLNVLAEASPDVIKINREELGNTIGADVHRDTMDEAVETLRRDAVATVIISDGNHAVRVYPSRQKPFDIVPPTVDVINPIGSGDVMSG
ncbi:MAG: hypothetical protein C0600_08530, partial [Ignavibacteria bacterium]